MIKDGVQVISNGLVQTLATGQRGTVQLPLSGTGRLPRVTGTVTMGNDTTLAGFNVTGFAGNRIVGTGIRNITIRDNTVTNLTGAGNGISLTGNLTGTVNILRNTFASLTERGINITPTQAIAQPLQIIIRDNTIDLTGRAGIESFVGGNTTATYIIANNTINRNAFFGIQLATFDTPQIRAIIDANPVQQTALAACRRNLSSVDEGMQSFQVKGEADQEPLTPNLGQASQRELTKSNGLLDNSNNRFNGTFSQSIEGLSFVGFQFISHLQLWGGFWSGWRSQLLQPDFPVQLMRLATGCNVGFNATALQLLNIGETKIPVV